MPTYLVKQDLNSGANPIGSLIDLTEEEAAALSHAVELVETATEEEAQELVDSGEAEIPAEAVVEADPDSEIPGTVEETEEEAAAPKAAKKGKGRGKK